MLSSSISIPLLLNYLITFLPSFYLFSQSSLIVLCLRMPHGILVLTMQRYYCLGTQTSFFACFIVFSLLIWPISKVMCAYTHKYSVRRAQILWIHSKTIVSVLQYLIFASLTLNTTSWADNETLDAKFVSFERATAVCLRTTSQAVSRSCVQSLEEPNSLIDVAKEAL